MDHTVRRSQQAQSPNITVERSGAVVVTVPAGTSIDVSALVEQHRDWIVQQKQRQQRFRSQIPDRSFADGAVWPVFGQDHTLSVERRRSHNIADGDILLARHAVERTSINAALESVYRDAARDRVKHLIARYNEKVGGAVNRLYIRDQDTKWGSCSGKNNISINWRLALGPAEVFEYVVVHELVHLEIRDHSARFWARLEELMPKYEQHRQWLADHEATLVFDPAGL